MLVPFGSARYIRFYLGLLMIDKSNGPWMYSGRYVRQKSNPDNLIATTSNKRKDTQLIAAAPELAAVLKLLLTNRDNPDFIRAAQYALDKAGEL